MDSEIVWLRYKDLKIEEILDGRWNDPTPGHFERPYLRNYSSDWPKILDYD